MGRVSVLWLRRDLRVHDHPALAAARTEHDAVVVLFVIDEAVADRRFRPANRAAFLDLALYDPTFGYYSRAAQRSGRTGDFFTCVDVGPVFGAVIAQQINEMAARLASADGPPDAPFDIVEAGAGNGRLSRDILSALRDANPSLYARTRLSLVEASPTARAAQPETLGEKVETRWAFARCKYHLHASDARQKPDQCRCGLQRYLRALRG